MPCGAGCQARRLPGATVKTNDDDPEALTKIADMPRKTSVVGHLSCQAPDRGDAASSLSWFVGTCVSLGQRRPMIVATDVSEFWQPYRTSSVAFRC
jgi:hypothetical protein